MLEGSGSRSIHLDRGILIREVKKDVELVDPDSDLDPDPDPENRR
jgi:hypothetical protein